MTLALTAAEIDALAKKAEEPFDYYLSSLFWKEADAQGVSSEKAEAFHLIGSALGFPFRAGDPAHPFGGSFEALTVEQTEELESIAPQIQTAQIRARLADVAWTRKRRNPASARLAVAAYVESARTLEDPQQWTECANRVERAARLSRSLGMHDESFAAVSAYLLEIIDKYRGNDPLFLTGKAVELLLEFEIGNPETYLECISRAAARSRDAGNFHLCRYYLDLLAKLYARRKDDQARNLAQREFAATFELEAEQRGARGENLAAAHFLNQAIQAHRRVPDSARLIAEIRPRLQQVEKTSIAELEEISVPIPDVGESALAARQHIAGQPLREAVLRLAHVSPMASFEGMKRIVAKIASVAPLSHMFTGSALDAEGRRVALKPPLPLSEKERDEAIFAHVVAHMSTQRLCSIHGAIFPAFDQLVSEHVITLQEMEALAAYSPFVPPGRERIFSQGLYAGFSRDFLTALHLLVPQIENSLRHLMQNRDIITTKLDNSGIQRQIDLNELVVDPRLSAIISEDILFELRCLLTDNRGPNLRNQLAHGMLDDSDFSSVEALYAWWLVLVLCIFSPVVKGTKPETMFDTGAPE
jgi:tetratricopeptide (TPR) repeat protein